jgi:predicted membrane channel-forming protein YqfA (hemolysin III family)
MLKKPIMMTIGGVTFITGMILFPLPVPFGFPTMIIGLSIMLKASHKVKRTLIRWFKKNRHSEKIWRKSRELRRQRIRAA